MTLHSIGCAPNDLEAAFTEAVDFVDEYLCALTIYFGCGISVEVSHDATLEDLFIQYCQRHLDHFLKYPDGINPITGEISTDVE